MRGKLIRSRPWARAALVYTALVYLSLPLLPLGFPLVLPVLRRAPIAIFAVAGGLVFAFLASHGWRAGERRRAAAMLLLAFVGLAYTFVLVIYFAHSQAVERTHLLEYGVLAYFLLNAFCDRESARSAGLALSLAALLGVLDEGIQFVLPNRYFDLRDILANWMGLALGALAWLAVSRRSPWRRPSGPEPGSVREPDGG